MVSVLAGALSLGGLLGGVVCWSGYRAYRLPDQLGRRWFVVFASVLGVGCVVTGVVGLVPWAFPAGDDRLWTQLPFLFWILSTFPWFLFALQYTGTRMRLQPKLVALLGAPYVLFAVQLGVNVAGFDIALLGVLSSVVFLYVISLVVGGVYLVLQGTYSAGHLPTGQGISLSAVPVGSLSVWNVIGVASDASAGVRATVFATGAGLAAVCLGAAVVRYDLFELTPAIDTLGERALTRETDDLMVVVDEDDRIISINETVVDTLGVARPDALGEQLADVVDHDTTELRGTETVQLQTTHGTRQYDPQVSQVADQYGNGLGAVLSLRDVTERELREQRLAVLNRVLRHNLRNQVDVVKGHAESLDAGSDQVAPIIDAADSIAALGQQAHRIDQYISESPDDAPVVLSETVRRVLDTVDAGDAAVSVSVDVPASARVVTNERALLAALESAIDNAIEYADSSVTVTVDERPDGCAVRVADDGPGIQDWELDSLKTGTEAALEHSTGVGLWQLKWAVMTLNGELSFDTENGTTVEFVVPDREAGGETDTR
jgi:PAS domain S-box-containing protein